MTVPGMSGDTDPDNPVSGYAASQFPIGAAVTVAYGSNERMFCTLGNLYRILGYLAGDVPAPQSDPDAVPPQLGINDTIRKYRDHVFNALPLELQAIDPPPYDGGNETADIAWLTGIVNRYGATVTIPPTSDTHANQRS